MKKEDPDTSALVTKRNLAEQLGCSIATVDRLIYDRQIPYIKIGNSRNGSVRIRQSAIDEFLASRTVETAS